MSQNATGIIEGVYAVRTNSGVPSNGTSCIQTVAFGGTITGGTFLLGTNASKFSGTITWSSTNSTLIANIQSALDALFGTSEAVVAVGAMTAGIGTATITFQNNSGSKVIGAMTSASSLTGAIPTLSVAITTPGITATHRGAPAGSQCENELTGDIYINQGTPSNPSWVATLVQ